MSSITASVRFTGTKPIRLMASTSPSFTSPIYSPYANGEYKIGWVKLTVDGLAPNTLYYLRPDFVGAVAAALPVGTARTPPAGAHSFSFAAGSCWNSSRNNATGPFIFDTLKAKADANEIQFFIHMGDIHYADIQVEDTERFRAEMDGVFRNMPSRNALMRCMPVYYMYDDHDAGGPDNGNGFDVGTQAGIEFLRKAAPNPSYAVSNVTKPPYFSFKRGRCRFIVTDCRNDRTPSNLPDGPSKYMFSDAQMNWFKDQLLAANSAGEPVFWVNTTLWIGAAFPTADTWRGYDRQRQEIADFVVANGMSNKIAIVSGDEHAIAFDNGTNSAGGLRIMQCAPLDQTFSVSPLQGYSSPAIGETDRQYGLINVTDPGSGAVTVRYRGIVTGSTSEFVRIDQTFSLG